MQFLSLNVISKSRNYEKVYLTIVGAKQVIVIYLLNQMQTMQLSKVCPGAAGRIGCHFVEDEATTDKEAGADAKFGGQLIRTAHCLRANERQNTNVSSHRVNVNKRKACPRQMDSTVFRHPLVVIRFTGPLSRVVRSVLQSVVIAGVATKNAIFLVHGRGRALIRRIRVRVTAGA